MKKNNIIIFNTDTVWALACPVFDLYSHNLIYEIKKRDKSKPLPVLCSSLDMIKNIAIVNNVSEIIINHFLPGPLTIILDTTEYFFNKTKYRTIGIRIPDSKESINIINEYGPLFATSLNDSGEKPLNNYDEIKLKYQNKVAKIYNLQFANSNISSTVIKIKDNNIEVLREGSITKDKILAFLNDKLAKI